MEFIFLTAIFVVDRICETIEEIKEKESKSNE